MHALYTLYSRCFPRYPVSAQLFEDLLQPNKAHIIRKHDGNQLIGFALVHKRSIALLCVEEGYRNQGIGSALLQKAEQHISRQGEEIVLLGRGKHYLLQGVPEDDEHIIRFFEKRGYTASRKSTNMSLSLADFSLASLQLPPSPPDISFRFATCADTVALHAAIEQVKPNWRSAFENCTDPILLAIRNEEIIGFEVLSPWGGRFTAADEKVGTIGCVGIIPEQRKAGIGRHMVAQGLHYLQSQQCTRCELRFVEIAPWYEKLGFKSIHPQWMGEKHIT